METIIKYDSVFNELDIIAFGCFGIVCKAIEKNSNKIFAIKKVPINKNLEEKTLREIEILSELKSEHIVKLESFWIQNNYYYRNDELKGKLGSSHELFKQNNNLLLHIQMELCYKTLKQIIQILNKELNQKQSEVLSPLGYYISSEIFIEILESVDYLHKQHLIHRNLKPNNILITDGRVGRFVKIADFGLAKIHKIKEHKDIEIVRYAAPEVMDGISYDTKVDIFSLGVIVQEIFNVDINEPIGKFSDLEMNYSNLFDLIARMLSTHSYERPSCEEILRVKKLWALSLTQLIKSTDLTINVKMMSIEESFSMFFIQTKYNFQNKYDQMTCQESLGIYYFVKNQALKNAKLIYVQEMDKHFVKQEFIFAKVLQDMHILSKCLSHNKFETDFFPNSINERIEEEFNNTIEKIYEQYKRQNLTYIPIKPAIGIDLGTNYSCVGVMIRGKVHIILSLYALNTSPSYIAFTKNGKVFNGKSADEFVKFSNKIYDLKREIKTKYDDYFNQEDMESLRIVVLDENNTHKVELRNNNYINLYPEELSTKILPQLKIDAENFLGFKVNNAVITVPAYFNDAQRQATKDAGLSAGLNVLQTLNKPTAAAIAYYYQIKDNFRKNVVIYDLGERTFEVTVVVIENGIIEVKAVGGDTHLGSVYFTQRVLDFLMETLKDKFSKAYNQTTTLDRLRRHCENKMWGLTEINSTIISINDLLPGYDFKYELTRKLIEDLCIDLFEKTIKIMDQTLKSTEIEANDIHEVVLIGGSTKIPQIQSLLQKYFIDKPLNQDIKPDETVAYGATIQAAIFNGEKFSNSNIGLIHDVSPFSIGIEASDKSMAIIIPRNTKIPCERTQKLQITKDKQSFILIQIFEGENKIAKQNILLGEFIIDGLLKKRPGKVYVEVTIKLDKEGIMYVRGVSSNRSANLTITEHRGRIPADELKMLSAKSYKEKQF